MNFSRIMRVALIFLFALLMMPAAVLAHTNCDEGAGPLNNAQPQGMTPQQIIQKFAAREEKSSARRATTMSIPRTLLCRNSTATP